jgi:hypothetical protein
MLTDLLRDHHCPKCGADALAAESERLGALQLFSMCEHLTWWQVNLWLVRCGLCAFVFPIVAQAEQVDDSRVLAASRER